MIKADELMNQVKNGGSSRPARPPIPKELLSRRRHEIAARLKAEGLEINPPDVFKAVCTHVAAKGLAGRVTYQRLPKGFILFGGVGCGKTTLVKRAFFGLGVPFTTANRVIQEALEYVDSFQADRRNLSQTDVILDDLGAEPQGVKKFGNPIDLAEWLMWRYDVFKRYGTFTYITTNLANGQSISDLYGARIASRIQEMCEVIRYDFPDRRAKL